MEKQSYKKIPMLERWKNDIPVGKTVGFREISNEERISARKRSLEIILKQGKITQ